MSALILYGISRLIQYPDDILASELLHWSLRTVSTHQFVDGDGLLSYLQHSL